jgi:HAD superfamily hydrolase (TIGR01548 family)
MESRPLLVQPNPVVEGLFPYVIERPGVDPDLILDFNESLAPPPSLAGDDRINRYPDYWELEAAIANHVGVGADRVLVTNGADDALERTVRSVVCRGRRAVLTTPSYSMIRRFAVLAEADLAEVPWWKDEYPVDEVCRLAGDDGGLVAVISPSNPTGAVASPRALEELLERVPRSLVLVDQAYVDFTEQELDLAAVALGHPNAVVVRTFSKAWGCAGLRVGCAIADPRIIDWLRRAGLPFPVSTPSVQGVLRALADGPDRARVQAIRAQREALAEFLRGRDIDTLPSEASFVFANFENAEFVWRGLGALGISVRAFPGKPELEGWLRITLPGDGGNFERLTRGLDTLLKPEALLFDMDGVLADVSQSYRQAIVETAAGWGVELEFADIERAKEEGNATNDWELARRLLAERGVAVDLEEVTERFEAIYQGSDGEPGLRRFETLRIDRDILARLGARLPLGIVTGRPRADASRFLHEQAIAGLFSVVVCMEDAPSKPDPAPVASALRQLGVSTAWMVGDTPDDLRAAREAGVLPIGVGAAGDDRKRATKMLTAAGAALVLKEPSDIEELLR